MINDYFRMSGAHDTGLDFADFFSVTLHDDNIQEFDTRWDKTLLTKTKIPSIDILESLHKLRISESDQRKPVLELYDREIHKKISMPDYQKLETMEKRSKIGNLDCETLTPEMRGLKQEQWLRVAGDYVVLKEEQKFAISGKQKEIIQEGTNAISGTTVMSVQNGHLKQLHPLSHQHQEVEVRRE